MKFVLLFLICIPVIVNANDLSSIKSDSTCVEIFENSIRTYRKYSVQIEGKQDIKSTYISLYYNDNHIVRNITGTIYNAFGKKIRTIKFKEINDRKVFSDNFVDDYREKHFAPETYAFPYTVEWEYEIVENSLFFLHDWHPKYYENYQLQKAVLYIVSHVAESFNYKEMNGVRKGTLEIDANVTTYKWTVSDVTYKSQEKDMPLLDMLYPYVQLSPQKFHFANIDGRLDNWQNAGMWYSKVNTNNTEFNNETKLFFSELTKEAKSDFEKIKILYKFLQTNTRYVSIQLGVGGWVSFPAQFVHDNKYGDCKALTTYMKAMLQAVGINSNEVLVYAGKNNAKKMDSSFVEYKFNHVILCVPNNADTVWLECTSKDLPCGMLGDFTSGRYGLLIDGNKSKIVTTQKIPLGLNYKTYTINLHKTNSETLTIDYTLSYSGIFIDELSVFKTIPQKKQEEYVLRFLEMQEGTLISCSYIPGSDSTFLSQVQISVNVPITKYRRGEKLYLPVSYVNVFNSKHFFKERSFDIQVNYSYSITEEVIIDLSANNTINFIPEDQETITGLVSFEMHSVNDKSAITSTRTITFNEGVIEKDKLETYKPLFNTYNKATGSVIVLSNADL